jgi:hypothetical protein
MSACEAQIFPNVSPEQFAALIIKAEADLGMVIAGNTGQTTIQGFTVEWNYDPIGRQLQLHCIAKPMFIPCGIINSKIQELVNGSLT